MKIVSQSMNLQQKGIMNLQQKGIKPKRLNWAPDAHTQLKLGPNLRSFLGSDDTMAYNSHANHTQYTGLNVRGKASPLDVRPPES